LAEEARLVYPEWGRQPVRRPKMAKQRIRFEKAEKGDVVVVEWYDHATMTGWRTLEALEKQTTEEPPCMCETVGRLWAVRQRTGVIVSSRSVDRARKVDLASELMKADVISFRVIEKAKKDDQWSTSQER
jgi:hypothetical protein